MQLKEKMKGIVLIKKRDAAETDLDADILQELIPETMNDVRTCVDISMFDFGEELDTSNNDGDADMGDEEFLNETPLME